MGEWCHRCGNDKRLLYDHEGEVLCERCYEPHRHLKEVSAERDRLHDALHHLTDVFSADPMEFDHDDAAEAIDQAESALREVEQGDTVAAIRSEAFEEAAQVVQNFEPGSGETTRKFIECANKVRDLAEPDDGGKN